MPLVAFVVGVFTEFLELLLPHWEGSFVSSLGGFLTVTSLTTFSCCQTHDAIGVFPVSLGALAPLQLPLPGYTHVVSISLCQLGPLQSVSASLSPSLSISRIHC